MTTVLECFNQEVPVLFREFDDLEKYCLEKKLALQKIPGLCCSEAIIASGDFEGRRRHFVDFVWVKASSRKYRDAVKLKWNLRDPDRTFPADLHVDHIVNRGSLKAMQNAGVDPWVMLFEVPWSANVGFGSVVERGSDQVKTDERRINITGLLLYKLYATDFPKSQADFKQTLKNIREQILDEEWVKRIENEITPFIGK